MPPNESIKVATPGHNNGIWICCHCRKWTLTHHPKCLKVRATNLPKPQQEYRPCFHLMCPACEELTEWGRESVLRDGIVKPGGELVEEVKEAGLPGEEGKKGRGSGGSFGWM